MTVTRKGRETPPDCANRERDDGQLYGGDIFSDPISLIYSFAVGNLDSQLIRE